LRGSSLGRTCQPLRRARLIEPRSRRIEAFPWQTTRVRPGGAARSALKRLRALGTSPPAGGVTDVSGAGSGQYDARSMWAEAVVTATTTATASAADATSTDLNPCIARRFYVAIAACAAATLAIGTRYGEQLT
jgi:hypothetical protein